MVKIQVLFAGWCSVCDDQKRELDGLSLKVEYVDVDKKKIPVNAVPVVIVKKGSKEVKRFVGFTPKERILELL